MEIKYPNITVKLTDTDGNAFAIIGAVRRALKRADVDPVKIAEFSEQANSGDYDNVIQTAMRWVNVT